MTTEKKRREGSIITVTSDMKAGVQFFSVKGFSPDGKTPLPLITLYHKPQPDGPPGMSAELIAYAAYHGTEQKGRDAGALGWDDNKKRYATPFEKWEAIKEVIDHLNSGTTEWSLRGGPSEGSLLFRALMKEKADRDPTKVKDWIAAQDAKAKDGKLSKGWRRELMESDRLIDIIRELRAEDGKALDVDKMLDSLDELDA